MTPPVLASVPFVVETPKAGHVRDVATLKQLRDLAPPLDAMR